MNTKNSITKTASENYFTSAVKIILSEFEQADSCVGGIPQRAAPHQGMYPTAISRENERYPERSAAGFVHCVFSEESCMQMRAVMEFHVSRYMRDKCHFDLPLFGSTGNVILANFKNVRLFAKKSTIRLILFLTQIK